MLVEAHYHRPLERKPTVAWTAERNYRWSRVLCTLAAGTSGRQIPGSIDRFFCRQVHFLEVLRVWVQRGGPWPGRQMLIHLLSFGGGATRSNEVAYRCLLLCWQQLASACLRLQLPSKSSATRAVLLEP